MDDIEDIHVRPLEPLAVVGSVAIRVVHGRVRCLGFELTPSTSEGWCTVHSPAGGLTALLRTPSAVSSGARVQVRRLTQHSTTYTSTRAVGKRRKGQNQAADAPQEPTALALAAIAAPVRTTNLELEAEGEELDEAMSNLSEQDGHDEHVDQGGIDDDADVDVDPSDGDDDNDELGATTPVESSAALRPMPTSPAAPCALGALVPAAWDAAAEALASSLASPPAAAHTTTVLLCGGRNVGKSSFARLLVNRALAEGARAVALLDCDVGQPELAPPGVISLHWIDQPLLGPPHTQLRPPHRCRFVGQTTPAEQPDAYVACVRALIAQHRAKADEMPPGAAANEHQVPPVPLVVNTCGWVSGLGAQLLTDIAAASAPTHVVRFEGAGRAPASAALSSALAEALGNAASPPEVIQLPSLHSPAGGGAGQSTMAPAVAGTSTRGAAGQNGAAGTKGAPAGATLSCAAPPAAEARALQMLAYLDALPAGVRALPGDSQGYMDATWQAKLSEFLSRPPVAVPLQALDLVCAPPLVHCGVGAASRDIQSSGTAKELLRCLNASIVGLLTPAPHLVESMAVASGALGGWDKYECAGLALVRSVDLDSGLLFLSTPVPPERLAGVTVLVRSSIELPLAILQPTTLTPISPFLAEDALRAAGSEQMRSRNNIIRRRLQ